MVALCEVPRNAEGAQYEGRAHKGHPKSAASGRIKKACAPKDAQSPTLSLYLSSASPPISASTATRLCVAASLQRSEPPRYRVVPTARPPHCYDDDDHQHADGQDV
jgi:hypothetical protein